MSNFKVGDWVRLNDGSVKQLVRKLTINSNEHCTRFLDDTDLKYLKDDGATIWQPKEDEWCVIPSTRGRTDFCASIIKYNHSIHSGYKNIEPFIGELPSFIKDKQ